MRIAINGFGRIGRSFFKQAIEIPELEIIAINDLGDFNNLKYLLKYDTVYGKFDTPIADSIKLLQEPNPSKLPWKDLQIDVVIESTGIFDDYTKAQSHLSAGAKKVIITAPAKGNEGIDGKTILLGINESESQNFSIISNGSCTTNAISSILAILTQQPGIKKAILSTTHAYTSTQEIIDSPSKKDFLRGRAGASNIIPASTGAANTITKVLSNLNNKFDGIALRVPVICGSIADITFISAQPTNVEEINNILTQASLDIKWNKLIAVSKEPLVSSDILKTTIPAIIDLSLTRVVDHDLVKIFSWYDNEWAYAHTLILQLLNMLK